MHGYGFDGWCSTAFSGTNGLFGSGWMVTTMGLGLLLIVALVVWLVWSQRDAAVRATAHQVPAPYIAPPAAASTHEDSAERIARERFARGEIDRDEYERLIAALRNR